MAVKHSIKWLCYGLQQWLTKINSIYNSDKIRWFLGLLGPLVCQEFKNLKIIMTVPLEWFQQPMIFVHWPLMNVMLRESAMLKVTAGFMCPPPKSPKAQAMVITMNPILMPTWTAPPKPLSHVSGRAASTDTNMKVATNSAKTSLQKVSFFGSVSANFK